MFCDVRMAGEKKELFLRLNFADKMQRELTSELKDGGFSFIPRPSHPSICRLLY